MRLVLPVFLLSLVAGCTSSPPAQPPNPDVTARIVAICTHSGFFKLLNGVVVLAYPPASLPVSIINMGIDRVCINPEKFSSDVSTVEWLLRNIPRQTARPIELHEYKEKQ